MHSIIWLHFSAFRDFLRARKYSQKVLNSITISRSRILNNYHLIRSLHPDSAIFPVVKSNAYGHGLDQILSILETTDAHMIAVDSYVEYQYVHRKTTKSILILGETIPENYSRFDIGRTVFCIWNLETIRYLIGQKKPYRIHLFLNTGMNREGIDERDIPQFLDLLRGSPLLLEWVCSHLADADSIENTNTEDQIASFKCQYAAIEAAGFHPKYRHIAASSGTLKIQDSFFNAVRPGLILYGYNPLLPSDPFFEKGSALTPALDLYSTITSIHDIEADVGVGYNLTYRSPGSRRIASVPCGYFEGVDRRLSSNFVLSIDAEISTPIAGRVSMNFSTYDITDSDLDLGDRLHLISSDPHDAQTIDAMTLRTGTIPYDILVHLNPNIRRILTP